MADLSNSIKLLTRKIDDYINSDRLDNNTIGPPGQPGRAGIIGAQGLQGSQGLQGIQGPNGFSGDQGNIGNQGMIGITGSQGYQGSQGFVGYSGITGNQSDLGVQGSQGNFGAIGLNGQQGSFGIIGNTNNVPGTPGIQGSQGFTGQQGMLPTGFILRRDTYQSMIGEYNIPWPLDSSGVQSPLIFITMAAGGGGSGGTSTNVSGPAPAGGAGGFIRRLPIYYESGMQNLRFSVGFGGFGGTASGSLANPGSSGQNSTFKINFTSDNFGLKLICQGGGGGGARISGQTILVAGNGGGVILEQTSVGGNIQRIICPQANGHTLQLLITNVIPPESSNINGNYESGSGGISAGISALGAGNNATPGAPSVIHMKSNGLISGSLVPPNNVVSAIGGASGMINYGFGANTVLFPSSGTPPAFNGLPGGNGVLILEYYF